MVVVEGGPTHAKACVALAESVAYRDGCDPSQGFLVGPLTPERFAYYLRHGVVRIARDGAGVVGFLIAYKSGSEPFAELSGYNDLTEWAGWHPNLSPDLLYIHQTAVARHARCRGVARTLYSALRTEFPGHDLYAATAEKPVRNEASLAMRARLGFVRVGTFRAAEAYGFKDFESGIYLLRATPDPGTTPAGYPA
ncbi:MAG TPA: GNAT family N-acetyltransferase [Urbifossiella sp.]|nr:GNAT family N-acetyltransferase [Urbifossiella sp.]